MFQVSCSKAIFGLVVCGGMEWDIIIQAKFQAFRNLVSLEIQQYLRKPSTQTKKDTFIIERGKI
jgi:hypothetical protein